MKLVTMTIVAVMLLSSSALFGATGDLVTVRIPVGDVNQDGAVDAWDVDLLLDYLQGTFQPTCPIACLDVNEDGEVNIADAFALGNMILTSGRTRLTPPMRTITVIRGDVNADGKVDIADFYLLLNFLVGPIESIPSPQEAADTNGDGLVNLADAVELSEALFPRPSAVSR